MATSKFKESLLGGAAKEVNKGSQSNGADEESRGDDIILQVGAGKRAQEHDPNQIKNLNCSKEELTISKIERSSSELESRSSSSAKKEQDDQLESAKAEMEEVMEENQRLKTYLDRIMKDYRTLQTQYQDVIQQDARKSPSAVSMHNDHTEEPEFFALSLGRTSSGTIKEEPRKSPINEKVVMDKDGLTLGLDCNKLELPKTTSLEHSPNPSTENSIDEIKEDVGATWPPNKTLKNARDVADDEISTQNPTKRARVSVRVRCDTPTMNDGCQWRKYGQKIAKGNPCPRAYYRCTVAPSCPVRKQVQRCAEDMSILTTTYEGTHNHPLPISATAMASTTSAAASMLLSGSSTSTSGPSSSSTTTPSNLNGLNFYLSDNTRPKPFYLPNSSISSSPSFPTITLDLTSNASSSASSSHLSRLANFPPRYSSTNLNFNSLESNTLPISWNNNSILTSYGSHQPFNKINQTSTNSLSFGTAQNQENLYHSYLQRNNNQQNLALPDTIAAATKAITSDPSFQSALAAALSSIIGTSATNSSTLLGNQNIRSSSNEPFPILSSFPSNHNNVNKCAPSSTSTSTQPGSLMFHSPSFPFSNSKSKSNSPGDHNKDHVV
ncbi:hypothetical protein ACJIZ3_005336 [Penstemon smallii]|uniref:WRKY domain-containing protein n=1 Tax=Penstemon smallii TaxID=265156 RepID=A0ABD3S4R3_9LAMI